MRCPAPQLQWETAIKKTFVILFRIGYNTYVSGCSADGVSEPLPKRRNHRLVARTCANFVIAMKITPEHCVRRVANILNKHTILRIVLNLLTTNLIGGFSLKK